MTGNKITMFSQHVTKSVGAALLLTFSLSALAGEQVDSTLDTSTSPKLDIEHVNGKADIRVWDKPQVRVTGELGDDTEEFVFEKRGDVVVIHVEVERHDRNWFKKSKDGDDLTIYVPASSDLHYTAVNADVNVEGITKAVDIEVVNGGVSVKNVGTKVEVESVNGDIELIDVNGHLEAEAVNGDIHVKHTGREEISVATVNGKVSVESNSPEVQVETVNGRIELKLQKIDALQINTVNGRTLANMTVNKNGSVKANSVGGTIELVFQKGVSAQFDIEAHAGGDIINKISDDSVKKAKYGPSSSLQFINNGGAANVDISTVHGRIVIEEK
ncbi:hypothetical protein KUL42_34100 [Alteromonas sp. KUL42]|uniref:DUF4097 family beta strand repeat-containing protein n=1 Tax=Alteromonas sp. KUL42 TaxID=2480797 RepID=UPI0010358CBB|nr:DUF4097 family beta strand repeat protein [Alteromonas sp. KUL42]TAP33053.1 hypothetical protein EYR97_16110 [Alteromonas sp. KUL42]GEA08649.1 hypothetical protein KUL42_34100 [Alteromonas sp. KUL42]